MAKVNVKETKKGKISIAISPKNAHRLRMYLGQSGMRSTKEILSETTLTEKEVEDIDEMLFDIYNALDEELGYCADEEEFLRSEFFEKAGKVVAKEGGF